MTRRKRRDFVVEARKSPFELDLDHVDNGDKNYVTFQDPNKLKTTDAFELQEVARENPKRVFSLLLGDDFDSFWNEWKDAPADETNKLLEDVMEHYQASPK